MKQQSSPATAPSRRRATVALVSALGALAAQGVQAQTEEGQEADEALRIQEVVVTATKRESSLQDVPTAISAITADDVAARGLMEFGDYLSSVPGVHFDNAGPGRYTIRIRGLSVAEKGVVAPTVATYFGDIPMTSQTWLGGNANPRMVDIERVEVLRGPQGAMFGANALAGAVRVIPAAPKLDEFSLTGAARWYATAHSDDGSHGLEATANLPLVSDKLAMRLVAFKHDVAGVVDNVFPGQAAFDYTPLGEALFGLPPGTLPPGTLFSPEVAPFHRKDVDREDTKGGRVALAWKPTDALSVDLTYLRQETSLDGEPETYGTAGEYEQSLQAHAFQPLGLGDDLQVTALNLSYDWDSVSLVSTSGLTEREVRQRRDITGFAEVFFGIPVVWGLNDRSTVDVITQELRLQSRHDGRWQWMAGVFFSDLEMKQRQAGPDYSCPNCLPAFLGQDVLVLDAIDFSEEQRAVFGDLSYELSDSWSAGVGMRWVEIEADQDIVTSGILGGAPPEDPIVSITSDSNSQFNPAFNLRYRPSQAHTLYLQAAQGFRSGSPNAQMPTACDAEVAQLGVRDLTEPDSLWNYELGSKSSLWNGRATLNAAVYYADWSDLQLPIGLGCGFTAVVNAGGATGQGVELEFAMQASDAWSFSAAASHNSTEFDGVRPETGFTDGERLPGSPRTNASAGLQYDFRAGPRWSGFIRGDYSYVGDVRVVLAGTELRQDAYSLANFKVRFASERLVVDLFARNVFDERGVAATGDPRLGLSQRIVRPREFGVELRYSYQ